jgi:starch-binding outer membrane protein, SusD/RagB family
MKRLKSKMVLKSLSLIILITLVSCNSDLLNQDPTTQMAKETFWKTPDDAALAVVGIYSDLTDIFARDYYFDGASEFQYTYTVTTLGKGTWYPGAGIGSGFDYMWNTCYTLINHSNYAIENIEKMISNAESQTIKSSLEQSLGEARFLRGLAYFRLIEMWGDVPYMDKVYTNNEQVAQLFRTPITQIKAKINDDFTYAIDKLPLPSAVTGAKAGRASKATAYAYRGKLQLYWASWNKFGWPELTTFVPSADSATVAYTAAANDFDKVINNYGLKLFRNGDPGTANDPNYFYLFQPENENDQEILFSVCFAGPDLFQGEYMMRDFGTRNNFGGQCRLEPTSFLVDRYQLVTTGDFAPKLVLGKPATIVNGACNPTTYLNRDYRMRATMLWNGQKMTFVSQVPGSANGDSIPFLWGNLDGVNYINYQGCRTGYIYRKWIRLVPGIRSDGPQDWYMMRLADVYLMYAEASNFASGPTSKAIDLVNSVRRRGALPVLSSTKTANTDEFFKAIEQERIVELISEGHRFFDIKRWRKANEIWGDGSLGVTLKDTWGVSVTDIFKAVSAKDFQKFYINRIPLAERERNPNLTQNDCWY